MHTSIYIKPYKKWSLWLKAYNFNITHIPGKQNVIADFLSRKPINTTISAAEKQTESVIIFIQDNRTVKAECVVMETRKDPIIKKAWQYTKEGWCNNLATIFLPYY